MERVKLRDLDALALPRAVLGGAPYRLIFHDMKIGRLVVPDYQRGRVWSAEQSARFVGYVVTGGQPPPIWVQQHPELDLEEIVDGLQRLSAMRDFFDDKIPALVPNGAEVLHSGFDPDCTGRFRSLHVNKMITSLPTRADVLRLYLRLNSGGTVHTNAELRRVAELLRREEHALIDCAEPGHG